MKDPTYFKFISKELTTSGLIDQRGNFFPCDFMGHNDLYDKLKDNGMDYTTWEAETAFVKVSSSCFGDLTLFVTLGRVLTGKQKVVIENIIRQYEIKDYVISTLGGHDLEKDDNGNLQWYQPKD